MNIITQEVFGHLPVKKHMSPQGWYSFNCVCCQAAGETTPDTRSRGGFLVSGAGGFRYHCFNCKTTASWEQGRVISKKVEFVLKNLGMSQADMRSLKFKAWQLRNVSPVQAAVPEDYVPLKFDAVELPKHAQTLVEWANDPAPPKGVIVASEYLMTRGEYLLSAYPFYWTYEKEHELYRRLIVPFFWKGKIVGWNARLVDGKGKRYFGNIPTNYLFNNVALLKNDREAVIIVEGIFDAIAIDGVAALGSSLSREQRHWINSSGRDVIVLPDRDKAGQELIDVALEEGWDVAFPDWEQDIKDAADAAQKYGRIFTIRSILSSREDNRIRINLKRKKFGS
jgi:hypothetical protein